MMTRTFFWNLSVGVIVVCSFLSDGVTGLLFPTPAPSVSAAYLYPYGTAAGDVASPRPADNNCPTSYDFKVKHQGGRLSSKIYVCTNGAISFDQALPNEKPQRSFQTTTSGGYKYNFLAPYFADIKLEAGSGETGRIWSRLIDGDDLPSVASMVNDEFWDVNTQAESEKFKPVEAVQVTWDKVKFATTVVGFKDLESTFQAILIRDSSSTTYAVFIYDRLEWASAPFGLPAQVMFQDEHTITAIGQIGTSHYFYSQLFSGYDAIKSHVTSGTNTNTGYSNGVWIYKMQTDNSVDIISQPLRPKVGETCENIGTDYCNKDIAMAECKSVTGSTSNRCECEHGSVPTNDRKSCTCPAGKVMLTHQFDPFFPDGPINTCEPANVLSMSPCEYPTSSRACENLVNGHCDVELKQCVCKKGYYAKRNAFDIRNILAPLYTCELAKVLSPCESPTSARACENLPNTICLTNEESPNCGCYPGNRLIYVTDHYICGTDCSLGSC